MKNKSLILILLLILCANCENEETTPIINIDNLYKVESIKISKKDNALYLTIFDNSYIYFEDYNDLKFQVLIHKNYEILKKYKSLKLTSTQIGRDDIYSKTYTQNEISEIKNQFTNPYLKRNLYLITSSFNTSELWNFRSTILQFAESIKDSKTLNYIEILTRHSELQNKKRKDSIATQRLELIRDFFNEEGIQDAWDKNDKRIDAKDLVEKMDLILKAN